MRTLILCLILLLTPTLISSSGAQDKANTKHMDEALRQYGIDPDKEITSDDFRRTLLSGSQSDQGKQNTAKRYHRSDYRQVTNFLLEHQVDPATITEDRMRKAFLD